MQVAQAPQVPVLREGQAPVRLARQNPWLRPSACARCAMVIAIEISAVAGHAVAGIESLTQRLPRPRYTRTHRPEGHIQDRRCLLVLQAFDCDEQQHFPVLLAQAQIRIAHLGKRDAGFLVARYSQHRPARRRLVVVRNDPLLAPDLADVAVSQDHEQPRAQVRSGLPGINLLDCTQQAFLNQIFGVIGLASEGSRVAP
jgi:hypothetical protein